MGSIHRRYGRKIYAWCRRWNLQEADTEDVTQMVLLKLAEKMRSFDYDTNKSFRVAKNGDAPRFDRLLEKSQHDWRRW